MRDGRLVWIPWDNNFSFGAMPFGLSFAAPPAPTAGRQGDAMPGFGFGSGDDVLHQKAGPAWPLISRLLADDTYRARYKAHLANALGGLYEPEALRQRVRTWHKMIAPAVAEERAPRTTVSSQQNFQNSIDNPAGLLEAVNRRRSLIQAALKH